MNSLAKDFPADSPGEARESRYAKDDTEFGMRGLAPFAVLRASALDKSTIDPKVCGDDLRLDVDSACSEPSLEFLRYGEISGNHSRLRGNVKPKSRKICR